MYGHRTPFSELPNLSFKDEHFFLTLDYVITTIKNITNDFTADNYICHMRFTSDCIT